VGESNSTSSGCRRRLPTLPPNRSPRNSISGEGCSTATLVSGGQHRNIGHNTMIRQLASEPAWGNRNSSQQEKPFDTMDKKLQQQIHGWIQFSLHLEQCNLYITVWSAQSLLMIEDKTNLSLPHPYAIVRLYSSR